jgi:hypothetical protein
MESYLAADGNVEQPHGDEEPPAPPSGLPWRAIERVVLVATLLLVIALFTQVRALRHEQQVQACYARLTGYSVEVGAQWRGHPQQDALARSLLKSCTSDDFRDAVTSDEWGRRPPIGTED